MRHCTSALPCDSVHHVAHHKPGQGCGCIPSLSLSLFYWRDEVRVAGQHCMLGAVQVHYAKKKIGIIIHLESRNWIRVGTGWGKQLGCCCAWTHLLRPGAQGLPPTWCARTPLVSRGGHGKLRKPRLLPAPAGGRPTAASRPPPLPAARPLSPLTPLRTAPPPPAPPHAPLLACGSLAL